ncbi:acetyl/propionyl/methylcrotonyl-CoA carboxylase subunit alpha [Methylocapsa polymorpha]|uniref:Acetyl/propionyl/methylcrotonyl-CoA carboxylase subunit alpha n=1 Tax=Methylocapsa polymorpha TaxID=3080828 RepID=A0ABZ0HP42_9HYPH|nr:acetyl/propionyl/methylcrotonyl-CoA carboxylase subunit alpha [Methylocapsa sp. RX1]
MPALFSKILIANRGEIACRIIRTARRLGIATVAVYSNADREALHVALADEAIRIGEAPARESYLAGARIIEAARRSGAEAIHPGYGFLSENADFADACAKAELVFIGPPAAAIKAMGDKAQAKALMEKAGVPLAPGYHGQDQDPRLLAKEAAAVGYPVLIKPSAGGGGKGMKIVARAEYFEAALESARREAAGAFGDDRVLIEKYLERPRHVEVQIFADAQQNCIHLFDRDCSIQRRHQKIIEEAPAPALSDALRQSMRNAAVTAARTISYVGAGTVEFLVPASENAFYFMEMNARLQVEHPVTEMITGLDLVEWQLRIAAGGPLPLAQEQIRASGHAIEARLYAEDPERDFLPQAGRIERLDFPAPGPHVRIDSGMAGNGEVQVHYDPMIAKLIVWDEDRPAAIRRLGNALGDVRIVGLPTNVEFLRRVAAHEAFAEAALDTGFIERHRNDLLAPLSPASNEILAMTAIAFLCARAAAARTEAQRSADPWSPWSRQDGWRLNDLAQESLHLREIGPLAREEIIVGVTYLRDGWRLDLPDGASFLHASGALADDGALTVDLDGRRLSAVWVRTGDEFSLFPKDEAAHRFALVDPVADAARRSEPRGGLISPMPGRIIALLVEPGARVEANQPILIIEAMKMEHQLRAPTGGIVKDFKFRLGDQAPEGAELVSFEAEES